MTTHLALFAWTNLTRIEASRRGGVRFELLADKNL
jgi:hypothetical protein